MKKTYAWALNVCLLILLVAVGFMIYFMPLIEQIVLGEWPEITGFFPTVKLLFYILLACFTAQILFALIFCIQVIRDAELEKWAIRMMDWISIVCLMEIAVVVVLYIFSEMQVSQPITNFYLIIVGFVLLVLFFIFGLWAEILKEKSSMRREVRRHDELEEPVLQQRRKRIRYRNSEQDTIQ